MIHATDTLGATAQNEYNYFNTAYRGASAHYFVDWTEIIRTIPENEVAFHAGYTANHKFLSVEICEPYAVNQTLFEEAWKRAIWLVADACLRYGWIVRERIFSHQDISNRYQETDHTDPVGYFARYGRTWADFLTDIEQKIQELKQEQGGNISVKNFILVGHGPDERAAGYLADYLRAPIAYLDGVQEEDLNSAQNIYVVGGNFKPIERAQLISGADRYKTCQKVLDFIQTGNF